MGVKISDGFMGGDPNAFHQPISIEEAHATFRRWLSKSYDGDALNAVLAAAAVERLDGDPLWLLVISGSGAAKTETVQPLVGCGGVVTSTISSEGALLSGTGKRDRAKDATGGLLRKLGDRGVLIIKDFTSIISESRDRRSEVLAALREIYDGQWYREVGTDGGKTLEWKGRIAVVGAVTTKWDQAHDVVAAMGDRFVLIRLDSDSADLRQAAGRQAIGNTRAEKQMREELAEAVGGVIAGMNVDVAELTDHETDRILAAADLVTRARTAVEHDYSGKVIDAHAPEMPTRFAKQLAQVLHGGVAIGMGRSDALQLAIRCARDSMPPLRLAVIDDVAANPRSTPSDTRRRTERPWTTIDRTMQALHMLGVLEVDEAPYGDDKTRWYYSLAAGIDPKALNFSPDLATSPFSDGNDLSEPYLHVAKSGEENGASGSDESDESSSATGPCRLCDQPLTTPNIVCPAREWHVAEATT
jgi:hypothetical protein